MLNFIRQFSFSVTLGVCVQRGKKILYFKLAQTYNIIIIIRNILVSI